MQHCTGHTKEGQHKSPATDAAAPLLVIKRSQPSSRAKLHMPVVVQHQQIATSEQHATQLWPRKPQIFLLCQPTLREQIVTGLYRYGSCPGLSATAHVTTIRTVSVPMVLVQSFCVIRSHLKAQQPPPELLAVETSAGVLL
jgi:hypothetical protein